MKLHLYDGHPHLKILDNTGALLLVPLEHEKRARSQREDGTWRLYGNYRVPDQNGGGTIRLRADQTAEDLARTDSGGKPKPFNREEHLRAITRVDKATWTTVYHMRPEAESHHRKLDDSLIREWAPSVGQRGQTWDMIMWAVTQNALAIAYHRKRKRLQESR